MNLITWSVYQDFLSRCTFRNNILSFSNFHLCQTNTIGKMKWGLQSELKTSMQLRFHKRLHSMLATHLAKTKTERLHCLSYTSCIMSKKPLTQSKIDSFSSISQTSWKLQLRILKFRLLQVFSAWLTITALIMGLVPLSESASVNTLTLGIFVN